MQLVKDDIKKISIYSDDSYHNNKILSLTLSYVAFMVISIIVLLQSLLLSARHNSSQLQILFLSWTSEALGSSS